MALSARLRVYAPNGSLTGSLPYPMDWELAAPLNDMPSLRLDYHAEAAGFDLINGLAEVAVELLDPSTGTYFEPPNCRFLNIRKAGDRLDLGSVFQFTMPSYGWQLRKVRNIDFESFDEDGKRSFTAATPGEIIASLINESKARGNIPQLDIDFDGEETSDGNEWDNVLTISIDAGQDVWNLVDAFSRQGMCDWRMNGRVLQMYNPDTFLNRDLTTDPAIILRSQFDHIAEPNDATYEELASKILVHGDEAAFLEVENPTALTPWGEWEDYVQQAGVEDTGTMELLAQRILEGKAAERIQMTRDLVLRDGSPLPLVNYRPGDNILSTDEDGNQNSSLRVRQITLTSSGEGQINANITLNDRFMERDLRNQRALNSLTGFGGPGSGGGSGGNPSDPPSEGDTRQPAAPQGLVVSSSTYINAEGEPVGQATATWEIVEESTGGGAMQIDRYEIQLRIQDLPESYTTRWFVSQPQTTAFVSPLDVEQTYVFRVRAVGVNARSGPWSDTVAVFIERDQDPTPPPSEPILTSRLGTIRATWDGLDEDGIPMPIDFSHIQVEMADNGAGPWTEVGRIFTGGDSVIITDLVYTQEYFFRLLSLDSSGNISDPSDVASTEVNRIEGPDIEANSITANEIAAGTITAEEIAAYSIRADRLAIGDARNLINDASFNNDELSSRRADIANQSSADGIGTWTHTGASITVVPDGTPGTVRLGFVNNLLVDLDLSMNTPIPQVDLASRVDPAMGNAIGRFQINITLNSGTWPAGAEVFVDMRAWRYNRTGVAFDTEEIVPVATFGAPTDGFVTVQSTAGGVIGTNVVGLIPYVRINLAGVADADVSVQVASPFLAQANGSVLIENGAITANKIVANAIQTTHLAADAITVKHTITGSFIQTAFGGQRITMGPQANFIGNTPAVRFWASDSVHTTTVMWNVDNAGTGNWTPGSFVIVGPETTRNSSGRADLNMHIGGGFYFRKSFVNMNNRHAGVTTANGSSELQLLGSMPRGDELGHAYGVFRTWSAVFQNGSVTWGVDNGWTYRTIVHPYNTSGTAAARYGSQRAASTSGYSWTVNNTVTRVNMLSYRGSFES